MKKIISFLILAIIFPVFLFSCKTNTSGGSSAKSGKSSAAAVSSSSKSTASIQSSSASSQDGSSLVYPSKAKNNGKNIKDRELFCLGDSILGDMKVSGYGVYLKAELDGKMELDSKHARPDLGIFGLEDPNGRTSRHVLAYLEYEINEEKRKFDIIMINCGIHDINDGTVPLEEYKSNLKKIIALVKANANDVVWCMTSPAPMDATSFYKNVPVYNYEAAKIMIENEIFIVDLFSITKSYGAVEAITQGPGDVHFNPEISEKQGIDIAKIMMENYYNYDLNR